MLEYKSTDQWKQCLAPGSNSQSTIQMLQIPVTYFAFCHDQKKKKKKKKTTKMEHMEHGTIKLKKTIVSLHIREAYGIGMDVA